MGLTFDPNSEVFVISVSFGGKVPCYRLVDQ